MRRALLGARRPPGRWLPEHLGPNGRLLRSALAVAVAGAGRYREATAGSLQSPARPAHVSTSQHTEEWSASAGPDPTCTCVWCEKAFRPRGAVRKRFCSDRCRAAFHRGCRVWAMQAIAEGRLSIEAVRNASKSPYTDRPEPMKPSPVTT